MIIQEHIYAKIFFRNDTAVVLNDDSIISASVRQQCCSDNAFTIGGVFAAQLSMKCAVSGTNSFRLRGAKIQISSNFGTENWLSAGTFWITDAQKIAGDIYQITALDAVGWLDSSAFTLSTQHSVFDNIAKYFEAQGIGRTIQEWCSHLTFFTNSLIERFTGETNVLAWKDFDESANGVYTNHYAFPAFGGGALAFFLSTEAGSGQSDCPRDLFRYLAYLAGGFIYADPDGFLTLGQFGMPELGTAEFSASEIQQDACEIADYQLQLIVASAQSGIGNHSYDAASSTVIEDYFQLSPMRIQADSNPFLDGFTAAYLRGDGQILYENLAVIVEGLYYFNHHFSAAGDWETDFKGISHIRPFRCRVHKAGRFRIGQTIRLTSPEDDSQSESILTAAAWTFRSGWELSCAGADTRTMADALRMSKAEKSLVEARTRSQTVDQKYSDAVHGHGYTDSTVMTQAEYDALENPDSNTLYVIREVT